MPYPGQLTEPFKDSVVQPALDMTANVLTAASKASSVKRIVITSSATIAISGEEYGPVYNDTPIFLEPPKEYDTPQSAYHFSKSLSCKATKDFIHKNNPKFTVIHIMPSFVLGKHELHTTPEAIAGPTCTNIVALACALGDGLPEPTPGHTVDVDDVAMVHVAALDTSKVPGNDDFLLNAGALEGIKWNDAKEIIERRFPEAVEKGLFPLKGNSETKVLKADATRAEKVFGFKYKEFEDQIVSLVKHYLEAIARAST
ncbi:MAG: hypothetical protein Q9220_007527 [cf. Caloplaca sp. 1 TL-2023]